jgi:hypothetical protein
MKYFILILLWLSVLSERDEKEFEEKAEFTNRINGVHSKRFFKRILSNPRNTLLPYGSSYGDRKVPYGDDISFGPIKLKEDLILNDTSYNGLFINTNGFISFEHSDRFEVIPFSEIEKPEIDVLFNDFDTKRSGSIFYKEVIDTVTLDLISSTLESDLTPQNGISLTSAFIVTWVDVPLYGEESINTFQLVLGTEANCSTYSILFYDKIDLGSMKNFTIGITSGADGLFLREVDQNEFLNLTKNAANLPLKYSFRLSESEASCIRNDKYEIYPYGLSNGDELLPKGDDISYGPILLKKEYSFYGQNYSSIFISTNGYVSFEFNEIFEPVAMSLIDKPTIAALFNDFDTKRRGNVFYRQTNNKRLLESISNEISDSMDKKTELKSSLIVTWDQVPTYGYENLETKNTFQLVLGSGDGENLFGILIYKNVSLGTLTNFLIGTTDGKQAYEDIFNEIFMELNIQRLFFNLNVDSSQTSSTIESNTSPSIDTTSTETSTSAETDTSTSTETARNSETSTSTETITGTDTSNSPASETTTSTEISIDTSKLIPIESSTSNASTTQNDDTKSETTSFSSSKETSTSISTSKKFESYVFILI